MKRIAVLAGLAAVSAFAASCTEVRVDESTVFAPVAFDKALADASEENIEGERGYGDMHAWNAAWDARVAKGVLTAPAPAFLSATVEHGKLPNGVAYAMITRQEPNRPLIVRCGGNATTRQKNGFLYTATAINHGDVFLFDYQGSGETGGEVTTEKFLAMGDGLAAAIRERAAGRRLILWGHSLGGVVCADMLHRLPETDGIILEATARNATEVAKAWTPWYAGPFVKITIEPGLKAYDVATLMKDFKGPALVLGATLDKTLPVQLARSLDKALKEEGVDTTYIEFKDGGHSSLPGQAGYSKAIDDFFSRVYVAS
jgi:uncharacterized protein